MDYPHYQLMLDCMAPSILQIRVQTDQRSCYPDCNSDVIWVKQRQTVLHLLVTVASWPLSCEIQDRQEWSCADKDWFCLISILILNSSCMTDYYRSMHVCCLEHSNLQKCVTVYQCLYSQGVLIASEVFLYLWSFVTQNQSGDIQRVQYTIQIDGNRPIMHHIMHLRPIISINLLSLIGSQLASQNYINFIPYNPQLMLETNPARTDPLHNAKLAAQGKCSCQSCYTIRKQIFPQSLPNDYRPNNPDNHRKPEPHAASTSKVTRYDLINKNYIFPQDKHQSESNYTNSYKNNSDLRVRTQKVNYQDNEMFPKGKFEGNSLYLDSYLNAPGSKGEQVKREGELKVGGKFEGQSNYAENYPGKGLAHRTEKVTFLDNKIMPQGKFEDSSTYNSNYLNNPPQYNPKIKPEGELKVAGGLFDAQSSYLADFSNKDRPTRSERAKAPVNQIMPKGRFEGDSTYGGSYQPGIAQRSEQFRPEGELKVGGKFQGLSSYSKDYDQRESPLKREKITFKDNQIMPQGGFDGNSTYNDNYIQGQGTPSKMIKHEQQLHVGGQFYGQSHYAQNYYNKGLLNRAEKIVQPHNKILPEGRFEENSTYTGNYVENPIQKNQQFKPEGQLKVNGGQFEGISNYGAEYIKKDMNNRAERFTAPQNDVMPKGKFLGNSTYEDTYVPSTVERNVQIRPQANLRVGGKFEGSSMYHQNYDNRQGVTRHLNKQNEYIAH